MSSDGRYKTTLHTCKSLNFISTCSPIIVLYLKIHLLYHFQVHNLHNLPHMHVFGPWSTRIESTQQTNMQTKHFPVDTKKPRSATTGERPGNLYKNTCSPKRLKMHKINTHNYNNSCFTVEIGSEWYRYRQIFPRQYRIRHKTVIWIQSYFLHRRV